MVIERIIGRKELEALVERGYTFRNASLEQTIIGVRPHKDLYTLDLGEHSRPIILIKPKGKEVGKRCGKS